MSCDVLQQETTTTRLWLINFFSLCNTKNFKFTKGCNRKSKENVFDNDSRCKQASDFL